MMWTRPVSGTGCSLNQYICFWSISINPLNSQGSRCPSRPCPPEQLVCCLLCREPRGAIRNLWPQWGCPRCPAYEDPWRLPNLEMSCPEQGAFLPSMNIVLGSISSTTKGINSGCFQASSSQQLPGWPRSYWALAKALPSWKVRAAAHADSVTTSASCGPELGRHSCTVILKSMIFQVLEPSADFWLCTVNADPSCSTVRSRLGSPVWFNI